MQQLCDAMNVPCASMHRLLSVLEQEGFVSRHRDNRKYFVGPSASDVGIASQHRFPITDWAESSLADLACATGAAALLTELVDAQAVCTLRCDGDALVNVPTAAGRVMPFHATAEAKGLLADLSRSSLSRLLSATDLVPYRPRTARSVEEVIKHVTLIRNLGYGVSYDEFDPGVWSLAAPVRNGAGLVVATVAVATTSVNVGGREAINFVRSRVIASAEAISAELGGRGYHAA